MTATGTIGSLRIARTLLIITVLAALCSFAWRGWYARYMFDDFCTAWRLHDLGLAGMVAYFRKSWSGRYAYYIVKGLLESLGPWTPRIVPSVLIVALVAAVLSILRGAWALRICGALTLTFALVAMSPSLVNVRSTLLWETGSITYVLPLVLFTAWIGLFGSRSSLAGCCVASAVLMFVAGGLSETALAAQAVMTGSAFVLSLALRDRRSIATAVSGFLATSVSAILVASAPGNLVRLQTLPPRPPISWAIGSAIEMAYWSVGSYLLMAWPVLLLIAAVGAHIGMSVAAPRRATTAGVIIIAVGAYVASFVPTVWARRFGPLDGQFDTPVYFALGALFAASMAAGSMLRSRAPGTEPLLTVVVTLLVTVPILTTIENARAIPAARAQARELDSLGTRLMAERNRDVVLPARTPLMIEMLIMNADWCNQCVSDYYGIRSLRLRGTAPLPDTDER